MALLQSKASAAGRAAGDRVTVLVSSSPDRTGKSFFFSFWVSRHSIKTSLSKVTKKKETTTKQSLFYYKTTLYNREIS